jgi:hypothetical protein
VAYGLWFVLDGAASWLLDTFTPLKFPLKFSGDPPLRFWVVDGLALLAAVAIQGRWQWPDWPRERVSQ